MMVWKVLRPHLWRLDHSLRKMNSLLVTGLAAALVLGVGWLWPRLVDTFQQALTMGEITPLRWLPSILFSLIILAALQLADTAYTLYLNPYNPLIMTAPLSSATLFFAKWLECARLAMLPAIIAGAVWIAATQALGLPWIFYLLGILVAGLVLAGMTTLEMLLVMLAVRLLPVRRLRAALSIFLTVAPLILLAFQEPIMTTLQQTTALAGFSGSLQLSAGLVAVRIMVVSLVLAAATWAAAGLFKLTYRADLSRMTVGATGPERVSKRRHVLPRLPFKPSLRAIIAKDWLETFRQPGEWLGLLIQPVLIVLLMLPVLRMEADDPISSMFFWMMVILSLLFSLTALVNQAMSSVAAEGKCLTLLKSSPLTAPQVHRAKWMGARWVLTMPVWWGMLFLISGYMRWPLWAALIAAVVLTLSVVMGAHLGTSLGMRWANFMETEPRNRFPRLLVLMVMLMSYAIGLLAVWTTAWLVYLTMPNLTISLPLAVVANTALGTWTLGTGWQTLLVQTSAWLALTAAAWRARRGAVRRWDLLEA